MKRALASLALAVALLALTGAGETTGETTRPAPASTTTADWTSDDATRPEGASVAASAARVLAPGPFAPPKLGMTLVSGSGDIVDAKDLVDGVTFFIYYSSSCPHCQHVAPEVAKLASALEGKVTFVGIGSGSNSVGELEQFTKDYGLPFSSYKDYSRRFARDNEAMSTPQLLLVRPVDGGFETLGEWRPLAGGEVLLAEIRARVLLGEDPFSAFRAGELHGSNACGGCHEQELRSWGLTHHSIAYWTLYERKEVEDPKCVGCHVTGLGADGGFVLGEHHSPLAEVGCESCHGAGGPHVPGAEPIPSSAARETCVGCHDAEHSVRFSVERALPHVDHFMATAFDPVAFRAAREALVDGKAPRPLTAFPEGKNLGNAACVECHKSESKAFRKDPHAQAMRTLQERKSAKDVACVTCHAVPKVDTPTSADDFHAGGVGCESCHGPGEQHVAEGGGTENIVGLGESCPVCVVEAICTRCHTPEQDPDWDLDTALSKIKHK